MTDAEENEVGKVMKNKIKMKVLVKRDQEKLAELGADHSVKRVLLIKDQKRRKKL